MFSCEIRPLCLIPSAADADKFILFYSSLHLFTASSLFPVLWSKGHKILPVFLPQAFWTSHHPFKSLLSPLTIKLKLNQLQERQRLTLPGDSTAKRWISQKPGMQLEARPSSLAGLLTEERHSISSLCVTVCSCSQVLWHPWVNIPRWCDANTSVGGGSGRGVLVVQRSVLLHQLGYVSVWVLHKIEEAVNEGKFWN